MEDYLSLSGLYSQGSMLYNVMQAFASLSLMLVRALSLTLWVWTAACLVWQVRLKWSMGGGASSEKQAKKPGINQASKPEPGGAIS